MRRRADSYQDLPPASNSSPSMSLLQAPVHAGPIRHGGGFHHPTSFPIPPQQQQQQQPSPHEPRSMHYRQPAPPPYQTQSAPAHHLPPPLSLSSPYFARQADYHAGSVPRSASASTTYHVPSGMAMAAPETTGGGASSGDMYPPASDVAWREPDWPPVTSPASSIPSPTDERREVRMQYGHSWPTAGNAGGLSQPPLMVIPGRRPPPPQDRYRPPRHQHSTSSSSSSSSSASSSAATHSTAMSTAASSSMHHPPGSYAQRHRHGKTLSLDRRAEAFTMARVQPYHFPRPYAVPNHQQSGYSISREQHQQQQQLQQQQQQPQLEQREHPRQHHYIAPPQHHYQSVQQDLRQPPPRLSSPSLQQNALASPLSSPTGLTRARSYRSEVDREEANRQKSKRHYDRKKDQRNALTELMAEMIGEVQRMQRTDAQASETNISREVTQAIEFRLPMPTELAQSGTSDASPMQIELSTAATATDSTSEADSTATPVKRANERKRLNKLMQRHLEMQRIQQLSHVARALEPMLRSTDVQAAIHRSVMVARTAAEVTPIMSPDAGVRASNTLFQPWLRCQDAWPHLLLAEERLSLMAGRPLARIVASLRTVLERPVTELDNLHQSASSTPKAVRRNA